MCKFVLHGLGKMFAYPKLLFFGKNFYWITQIYCIILLYICIKAYKVGGVQKSLSKPIISILKSQQPDVSNHPYQMWCQIYVKATKQTHTLDGWYFLRNCKYKTHTFFDPWILFSYIFVWLLAYDVFQVSSKWMCDVYFCEISFQLLYVAENDIIHFINPTFR